MKVNEIGSIAEFLEVARSKLAGFGQSVYWYRGHSCADWALVPYVHRMYDGIGEHNLTARFMLGAPTRHARCPEISDLAGWICLMQHYGLPTRLLDWTGSPLIALFFAVSYDPEPGPAAIWVLVPSELNRASGFKSAATFVLNGPEARALLKAGFDEGPIVDEVLAVVGQDLDLRMTVQQAGFTLHGSGLPLESMPGANGYLAKFVIPETKKATLAEELWALGIRRAGLFPDLGNLAVELRTDSRLVPPATERT